MESLRSSAVPVTLDDVALAALRASVDIATVAGRASAAVDRYHATCAAAAAVVDPGRGVRAHSRGLASLATLVTDTSLAFSAADDGVGVGVVFGALVAAGSRANNRSKVLARVGPTPKAIDVRAIEQRARASGDPVDTLYRMVNPEEFAAYAEAARRGAVDTFDADWSNDGCSDHGVVTRGYDRAGCLRHDFAYRNWFRFESNAGLSDGDAAKKLQSGFDAQLAADSVVLGVRAGRSDDDASEHAAKIYYGLRLAARLGRANMTERPEKPADELTSRHSPPTTAVARPPTGTTPAPTKPEPSVARH